MRPPFILSPQLHDLSFAKQFLVSRVRRNRCVVQESSGKRRQVISGEISCYADGICAVIFHYLGNSISASSDNCDKFASDISKFVFSAQGNQLDLVEFLIIMIDLSGYLINLFPLFNTSQVGSHPL